MPTITERTLRLADQITERNIALALALDAITQDRAELRNTQKALDHARSMRDTQSLPELESEYWQLKNAEMLNFKVNDSDRKILARTIESIECKILAMR